MKSFSAGFEGQYSWHVSITDVIIGCLRHIDLILCSAHWWILVSVSTHTHALMYTTTYYYNIHKHSKSTELWLIYLRCCFTVGFFHCQVLPQFEFSLYPEPGVTCGKVHLHHLHHNLSHILCQSAAVLHQTMWNVISVLLWSWLLFRWLCKQAQWSSSGFTLYI